MALPDSSRLSRNPGAPLTARFREIGLTREYVRRMTVGTDDLRNPLTASREAEFSDDRAALGLRLFFCAETLARDAAAECLGCAVLVAALDCGLLIEAEAGRVEAPFHLRTVRNLYLFSDYLGRDRDAVMGAGETTAILFRAARPGSPAGRVLDLGCGAGTLALLLAAHAGAVTGTDINPRALELARLNADVNGIRNAEFRGGDVWEPAARDVFDLIVSQPPYYPNRTARGEAGDQVFLHGGERGDELARRVVAGVSRHLTPGGRAIIFTSWPEAGGNAADEGMEVLELRTDRRELHGTRQSINVMEFAEDGAARYDVFDVAADHWGNVDSAHIDRLHEAFRLLAAPRDRLYGARLRLPEGASTFREGAQMIVQVPLAGTVAVDERTWEALAAVNAAPDVRASEADPGIVGEALRRGLLAVVDSGSAS
ncbi:MAG: methyltransferase [Acidobacteriota bacterium]